MLETPPRAVTERWVLATEAGRSHIITMPGVSRKQIDEFLTDLQAATTPASLAEQRRESALPAMFEPSKVGI